MKKELINKLGIRNKKSILNPDWKAKGNVHDWRNYVETGLQEIWECLSLDSKIVVYFLAENMAKQEEWD